MAALLDIVKKGATDRSVTIRIIDSTDGTPETGVVYNTSGIDLWYRRESSAKVSITEAVLGTPALTDAHTDGGFLHIGDGEYRLDLPDAAFATGANHVDVGGTVTGMVVIGGRVRLVNYDPEDTVRLGLTALPNAAADAAGGLPISDAGGLDMDAILADTNELQGDWTNGGRLDLIIDAILLDTAEIGAAGAGLTEAGGTGDHLTALATAAALATVDGNVDAILLDTAEIGAAGAGLTAIPWNAAWDAEVQSECNDALVALNLDHLILSAVDTNFATTVHLDSVIGQLADPGTTATFDRTTDSLEALRNHVGDGTNLTEAGGTGDHLTGLNVNVASMDADVLDAAALAADAVAEIADGVADEALAGHSTAGSLGKAITDTETTAGNVETDTQDIQSRLPAALTGGGNIKADVLAISGSATAADKLEAHALETLPVTFTGGTTTTAVLGNVDGSAASSTNDAYKGRLLFFNVGTLDHQVAEITAYDGATTTATISAVTTSVTSSHTAVMV
ncbi:MAG: hypothetical protein VW405_00725 [Rhodospirillaceae bacterium]